MFLFGDYKRFGTIVHRFLTSKGNMSFFYYCTGIPFIRNSVDFIVSTRYAKNIAFFPEVFLKIKSCSIFRFTEEFKCI